MNFVSFLKGVSKMSKYIDERPLEQIVRETVLDGNHTDYIESITSIVLNDEQHNWCYNTFKGDSTLFDSEISHLRNKKQLLQSDFEKLDKQYQSVLVKVSQLDGELDSPVEDEEEEENDEDDYYNEKGKATYIKAKTQPGALKPADLAAKRKKDEVARRNFKATLATLQEDLRSLMQEMREVDGDLHKDEIEQDIQIKMLRTLRRIIEHYKKERDIEFVKKGAYFVKDYSDKLRTYLMRTL